MTRRVAVILDETDPVALGQNIRRRRRELGLTQADVAGSNYTGAYLSRVETGDRTPSMEALRAFAAVLRTTPQALLIGVGHGLRSVPAVPAISVATAASDWLKSPTDLAAYKRLVAAAQVWDEHVVTAGTDFDVEAAAELARDAHAGQVDKQERDYFTAHLEPIAQSLASFGPAAVMAGYLHDVLEDTEHTVQTLAAYGVPAEVIDAVVAVTKVDGEPYSELIERAAQHPLGRLVKLADNALNIASNPGLAQVDPDRARRMLEQKYLPARARLLDGLLDAEHVLAQITADLRPEQTAGAN
jgi:transcriptional regulator with XRE-family HTH domain